MEFTHKQEIQQGSEVRLNGRHSYTRYCRTMVSPYMKNLIGTVMKRTGNNLMIVLKTPFYSLTGKKIEWWADTVDCCDLLVRTPIKIEKRGKRK